MARLGRIPSRTQSSVAISAEGQRWFLVNASPDLPRQIEANPALHPQAGSTRNSPIAGVLLTDANVDHLLGLFTLREGSVLNVWAPPAVAQAAQSGLGVGKVLGAFCGSIWREPSPDFQSLTVGGQSSGLSVRAIPLGGDGPLYFSGASVSGPHHVAYQFRDDANGRQALVAPDVASVDALLTEALGASELILFDGTFWSNDELGRVKSTTRTARQMGHVTVRDESLALLARHAQRRPVYIHINNTNPILLPDSAERRAVENAGVTVGADGMEFEL